MQRPVYLDNNATTAVDPRVLEAMLPYFTAEYGNASSASHAYGWAADEAVTQAREQVAGLIRCAPDDIVFTSGATEALNLALKGRAASMERQGRHIVITATEHRAVLDTCAQLRRDGFEITTVRVERDGRVDPDAVASALRDDTILVCAIWANNETGVLHPVPEISELARGRGIALLSDATQAVGKIPVDAGTVDLLVGSAHKFYGPKGVGFLYVNPRMYGPPIVPLVHGGGQERGIRGGTLNTAGIVAMGRAAEIAASEMQRDATRLSNLRDRLERTILSECPDSAVNGSTDFRLPQTTNLRFEGAPSAQLMATLRDVAVSSGSACSSGSGRPSHVLKAMGLSDAEAGASIRIGLGRFTVEEDVNFAADRIVSAVADVRERQAQLHG